MKSKKTEQKKAYDKIKGTIHFVKEKRKASPIGGSIFTGNATAAVGINTTLNSITVNITQ